MDGRAASARAPVAEAHAVHRAPMRSRDDRVAPGAAVERALRLGVCGIGGRQTPPPATLDAAIRQEGVARGERAARRLARFVAAPDGAFVWTIDRHGNACAPIAARLSAECWERGRLGWASGNRARHDEGGAMEPNPETTRPDEDASSRGSGLEADVPEADALEQRRELVEDGDDPERTAGTVEPDLTGVDADPADVYDQTIEVPHDEEPPVE